MIDVSDLLEDDSTTSSFHGHKPVSPVQFQSLAKNTQIKSKIPYQAATSLREITEDIDKRDDCKILDGREYPNMMDSIYDAVENIEYNGGRRENYVFLIHPITLDLVRGLYDFFTRSKGIEQERNCQVLEVPFVQTRELPEGWLLLANKEKGYRLPMSLIKEFDAGYRQLIELANGGSMEIRVINA